MTARHGFSLVELLVVIAIIAALASMIMPGITAVREQAKRSACGTNLRALGAATIAYGADNEGLLPGGDNWNQACNGQWYSTAHKAHETYLMEANQVNSATPFKMMRCPANPKGANYAFYPGTPWDHPATLQQVINCARKWNAPGGWPVLWADQTCLVGANPIGDFNTACNHKGQRLSGSSGYPAGGNASFADGGVRWMPYRGDVTVDEPAWILNGGSIGGWRAVPNNMVLFRLDGTGNLELARADNLIIGRSCRNYANDF